MLRGKVIFRNLYVSFHKQKPPTCLVGFNKWIIHDHSGIRLLCMLIIWRSFCNSSYFVISLCTRLYSLEANRWQKSRVVPWPLFQSISSWASDRYNCSTAGKAFHHWKTVFQTFAILTIKDDQLRLTGLWGN